LCLTTTEARDPTSLSVLRDRMQRAFAPSPPVPWFFGRECEMEKLDEELARCSRAVLVRHSAVGKSELLRAYCASRRDVYPGGVWWLHAGSIEQLTESFVAVAMVLGLPEAVWLRQEEGAARASGRIAADVFRSLASVGCSLRWLLCIDGADSEPVVRRLCAAFVCKGREVAGHVVVTSRLDQLRHWAPGGFENPIDVHALMPHDSARVLVAIARRASDVAGAPPVLARADVDAAYASLPQAEQDAVVGITQTTGDAGFEGLPLAIELCGHCIRHGTVASSHDGDGHGVFARYLARLVDATRHEFEATDAVLGDSFNTGCSLDHVHDDVCMGGGVDDGGNDVGGSDGGGDLVSGGDGDDGGDLSSNGEGSGDIGDPGRGDEGGVGESTAANDLRAGNGEVVDDHRRGESERRQTALLAVWRINADVLNRPAVSSSSSDAPTPLVALEAMACFEPSCVPEPLFRAACGGIPASTSAIESVRSRYRFVFLCLRFCIV
jgi:hypothetical protein